MNFLLLSSVLVSCRDLGVHIDGFIANVAHSFVVGASKVKAVAEVLGVVGVFSLPQLLLHVSRLGETRHRPES